MTRPPTDRPAPPGRRRSAEGGFSLVEVVVALVVLLLVLVPVSSLLATVFKVGANARNEQAATAIATATLDTQTQSGPTALLGDLGDDPLATVVSGGQTYTLEREVAPYQPGDAACVSPGSDTEAMLKVIVWVTWAHPAGSDWWVPGSAAATGRLVQESSLLALPSTAIDPTKGSILVSIKGAAGQGQQGLAVTATPPAGSGAQPITETTTEAGCALFANVVTGTWTVSASQPGYIDGQDDWVLASDSPAPLSGTALVSASATATLAFNYDQAALIAPQYTVAAVGGVTPSPPVGASLLPLSLYNSSLTIDPYVAAAPAEAYPFATTPSYFVVAGSCGAESDPDGASVDGEAVDLTPGATASPVLDLVPIEVVVAHGAALLSGAQVTAAVSNASGTGADPNCPGASSPLVMPTLTLGVTCTSPGTCTVQAAHRAVWRRHIVLTATSTTTSLSSSQNPSSYGQSVTFTATVHCSSCGSQPSGSVTFSDGSTTLATVPLTVGHTSSTATYSTSSLAVGTQTIKASYGGGSGFGTSSATLSQTVNAAATTTAVTSVPNPSAYGTSVVVTATVTSATGAVPTGTVSFSVGSTAIPGCSALALNGSGVASCTASNLAGGTETINAAYTPSGTSFTSSNGSITQSVTAATTTTTLTSSANPSTYGTSVTLTASVAAASGGPAAGTVTFFDGATAIGGPVAVSGGTATFTTSTLATGGHSLSAVFTPTNSADFSTSTGSLSQVVNAPAGAPEVLSGLPEGVWLLSATYTSGGTTYSSANSPTKVVVTVTASGLSVDGGPVVAPGSVVTVPVQ